MEKSHHCTVDNCSRVFTKKSKLRQHLASTHKISTDYICKKCDAVFDSQTNLTRHNKVHVGYNCEKCSCSFSTWSELTKHCKSEHRVVAIKCGGCRKKVMSKEDLVKHYPECPKLSELTCKFCSRQFSRKGLRKTNKAIINFHQLT